VILTSISGGTLVPRRGLDAYGAVELPDMGDVDRLQPSFKSRAVVGVNEA